MTREQAKMEPDVDRDYIYRSLFNNIPVGFYRTTVDGRILEANDMLVKMLGYPDKEALLSVKVTDIFVEPRSRFEEQYNLVKKGILQGHEIQLRRRDGTIIWVEDYATATKNESGEILYYEGSLIDIRDRKQLEDERLKAGKIELLKLLVEGISHDFTNLLTIIFGNTALIKKRLSEGSKILKPLARIEKACREMDELINQFYLIIEEGESTGSVELIQERIPEFLDSFFKRSSIRLVTDIPAGLWPVRSSRDDLNQVIRNLVLNAQDAIEKEKGGTIEISGRNITLAENHTAPYLKNGKYVKLTIRDNGKGIPGENLSKIFDPYFSTKLRVTDKGRGLGLAIAQALAKKRGGDIKVTSEAGIGTTAEVFLPAADTGRDNTTSGERLLI